MLPMLAARFAMQTEFTKLHRLKLAIWRENTVSRQLMTVPSVGPMV
ncbi:MULTISPECIES: hypothetical protein [Niveispirillum]|nr:MULTISPECIES: hypothetical protein [Niveispirillum]